MDKIISIQNERNNQVTDEQSKRINIAITIIIIIILAAGCGTIV